MYVLCTTITIRFQFSTNRFIIKVKGPPYVKTFIENLLQPQIAFGSLYFGHAVVLGNNKKIILYGREYMFTTQGQIIPSD